MIHILCYFYREDHDVTFYFITFRSIIRNHPGYIFINHSRNYKVEYQEYRHCLPTSIKAVPH